MTFGSPPPPLIGYHLRRGQLNASAAALTSLLERCDTPASVRCRDQNLRVCLFSSLNVLLCLSVQCRCGVGASRLIPVWFGWGRYSRRVVFAGGSARQNDPPRRATGIFCHRVIQITVVMVIREG